VEEFSLRDPVIAICGGGDYANAGCGDMLIFMLPMVGCILWGWRCPRRWCGGKRKREEAEKAGAGEDGGLSEEKRESERV